MTPCLSIHASSRAERERKREGENPTKKERKREREKERKREREREREREKENALARARERRESQRQEGRRASESSDGGISRTHNPESLSRAQTHSAGGRAKRPLIPRSRAHAHQLVHILVSSSALAGAVCHAQSRASAASACRKQQRRARGAPAQRACPSLRACCRGRPGGRRVPLVRSARDSQALVNARDRRAEVSRGLAMRPARRQRRCGGPSRAQRSTQAQGPANAAQDARRPPTWKHAAGVPSANATAASTAGSSRIASGTLEQCGAGACMTACAVVPALPSCKN